MLDLAEDKVRLILKNLRDAAKEEMKLVIVYGFLNEAYSSTEDCGKRKDKASSDLTSMKDLRELWVDLMVSRTLMSSLTWSHRFTIPIHSL